MMNEINEYMYEMEKKSIDKTIKNNKIQKNFQLTSENAMYLARLKYEKGIKYSDLMNLILDNHRINNDI